MQEFWFYLKLGLQHVLDINAYDHILFLMALVIPFTFKSWKKVLILATIFTITHCLALLISVYELWVFEVRWIEFLIPVTIMATAIFNLVAIKRTKTSKRMMLQIVATGFFGFIHGFGFSNYFKMMVMDQQDKVTPLLGFASGIEVSQVTVVLVVLVLAYVFQNSINIKKDTFITIFSILIMLITIPLLYNTIPI